MTRLLDERRASEWMLHISTGDRNRRLGENVKIGRQAVTHRRARAIVILG